MRRMTLCLLLAALLLAGCGTESEDRSLVYAAPAGDEWAVDASAAGGDAGASHGLTSEGLEAMQGDVIEIREKMFIAQTNDIYINADDYMGKTFRYEGIFLSEYDEGLGRDVYYVIRYGPGCCGYDGTAGFEVEWEGEAPEPNSWVEVTGVLDEYTRNGWPMLWLRLESLEVKTQRGAETVLQ